MTTFTQAMLTDLDPGEMFPLKEGVAIPRGAVLAILAFLDMHGITDVHPGEPGIDGIELAVNILADLDPKVIEAEAMDRAGAGNLTGPIIECCIDAILRVARRGN